MPAAPHVSAAALGVVSPEKDKAGIGPGLIGSQIAVDARDSADSHEERKRFATLQARAALKGIVLIASQDERGRPEWLVSWYALARAFTSLGDVADWLDRVEGRRV